MTSIDRSSIDHRSGSRSLSRLKRFRSEITKVVASLKSRSNRKLHRYVGNRNDDNNENVTYVSLKQAPRNHTQALI